MVEEGEKSFLKVNKSGKHWVNPVSSLSPMLIAQGDKTFSPNLLDHGAPPEKVPWRTHRKHWDIMT